MNTFSLQENPDIRQFVAELRRTDARKTVELYPKFSIVMPTYNHKSFIERSILSVLNQNYPNLEFIIIDGGSTDGTVDIIRRYESYLSYWISEPDQGQSDALNKGFSKATGDIFGWLNSDDLYLPDAFNSTQKAFSEQPDKTIVFADWLLIDTNDNIISHEYAFDFSLGQFKYEGFHLHPQAMFWRKEVHHRFGEYDKGLHINMDYQMIIAFGINEGEPSFLRLPATLGCFRQQENQKTGSGSFSLVTNEHREIAKRYGYEDKFTIIGKLKRLAYRFRRAYWYLLRGGIHYILSKSLARHL